jgi:antitoxin Phd
MKKKQVHRKSRWKIQEAKSRFDELFKLAHTQGPQTVVKGKEAVVIISTEQYARLTGRKQALSLVEFFAESPLVEANLDLERTRDYGRELKLFSGPNHRRRHERLGEI